MPPWNRCVPYCTTQKKYFPPRQADRDRRTKRLNNSDESFPEVLTHQKHTHSHTDIHKRHPHPMRRDTEGGSRKKRPFSNSTAQHSTEITPIRFDIRTQTATEQRIVRARCQYCSDHPTLRGRYRGLLAVMKPCSPPGRSFAPGILGHAHTCTCV